MEAQRTFPRMPNSGCLSHVTGSRLLMLAEPLRNSPILDIRNIEIALLKNFWILIKSIKIEGGILFAGTKKVTLLESSCMGPGGIIRQKFQKLTVSGTIFLSTLPWPY